MNRNVDHRRSAQDCLVAAKSKFTRAATAALRGDLDAVQLVGDALGELNAARAEPRRLDEQQREELPA